jgi:hypothetical protein
LIGVASGSVAAATEDSTGAGGGDTVCAFAQIEAAASEDAPYFTNRRRDNFRSVANGPPRLRAVSTQHSRRRFARSALVAEVIFPSIGHAVLIVRIDRSAAFIARVEGIKQRARQLESQGC